ncbi:MAG: fibronectin type III domain-containing protein, partial [Armatimonadota bacterium]
IESSAVADDRWHHAALDLQGALTPALGRSAPLVVTDLAFASSGWPGNRRDTRWWLDNVRLTAALAVKNLPRDLALHSRDESGLAGFAWVVDGAPDTDAPAGVQSQDLREALATYVGMSAWLHAVAVDKAGNRSATAAELLRLAASEDTEPPVASSPVPDAGAKACPSTISVKITDKGAGVSPADLRLTINGRTWTIADQALSWNAASGQLTWMLPAGLSLGADGSRVSCRLAATDLAGNAAPPLQWAFTLDYALQKDAPDAPVVSYLPARCADRKDFEADTGGWGNFWDSQVLRLARGGATGPGCVELRYIGTQGSGFVLVRDFREGWREFPMLRFRYRALNAPGATFQVFGTTFDGGAEQWTPLGTFPVAGNEWQSAELDLAQALGRVNPSLDLHRIFLSVALPPDGALLVDDYAMYSQAATRATFRWAQPASPSGLAGYSWVLDSAADTLPPEKIMGSARQAEFTGLGPGRYVFHVRACDGAGHWGPASRVSFALTAPSAGR